MAYQRSHREGFTASTLGEMKTKLGMIAAVGEHFSVDPGKPSCLDCAWAGRLGFKLKRALFIQAEALEWLVLGSVFPKLVLQSSALQRRSVTELVN